MKRTTYIFIGVFLGGMLLSLIGILTLRSMASNADASIYNVKMPDETLEVDLKGIQTVKLQASYPNHYHHYGQGKVKVVQAKEGYAGKIVYPASEYIKVRKEGATLLFDLDLGQLNEKNNDEVNYRFELQEVSVLLEVPETCMQIENELQSGIVLEEVKMDSLHLSSRMNIQLNNCNLGSLVVGRNRSPFSASNTSIEDMYIDLDENRNWTFDNCTVGTQYLTGSKKVRKNMDAIKGERIIWQPKTDNAELTLTINKAVEIVSQ